MSYLINQKLAANATKSMRANPRRRGDFPGQSFDQARLVGGEYDAGPAASRAR